MVRTVIGDLPRELFEGKRGLAHEHVRCVSNDMLASLPGWIERDALTELATDTLVELKNRHNVGLYVDATPDDLGRDSAQLREVSERSGVAIVAACGLYHYPAMLTLRRTTEQLAEIFLRECRDGLDGTAILPGMLKCATDSPGVTADNAKRLAALAIVQSETGLPLYAHCRHVENSAQEQLDIFEKNGTNLSKVVIGHATSRLEVDYLARILERGCYIALDQPGNAESLARVVAELTRRGFAKKLLFSVDHPIYNDFSESGQTGFERDAHAHASLPGRVFAQLLPAFEAAGVPREVCEGFVGANLLDWIEI